MQQSDRLARIQKIAAKYSEGTWFHFNHLSELYLYEFYFKDTNFQLAEESINEMYQKIGDEFLEKELPEQALECYQKGLEWNPVDLELHFASIEAKKKLGRLEEVKEDTLAIHPYLVSRATMARFYRNLGFYYLESYQPNIAVALYEYSNLFFETKNAKSELAYLEEALKEPNPSYSTDDMIEILTKESIPLSASNQTLGLLYELGRSEEKRGNKRMTADCYMMVYDLTQDEEIREWLVNNKE